MYTEDGPPVFLGDFAGNLPQNEVQGFLLKWWFLFWYHTDFSFNWVSAWKGKATNHPDVISKDAFYALLLTGPFRRRPTPQFRWDTAAVCFKREEGTEGCSIWIKLMPCLTPVRRQKCEC